MGSRFRSFPRRERIAGAIAATCVAGLVLPASAPAAVTIGQTAPGPGPIAGCQGGTLWVQQAITGPPVYTVPEGGGVLTSWSVQGANFASGPVKLKLVRPAADGTSYSIVAEDSFQSVAQGVLNTYATRIPVSGGEVLSLWLQTSAGCFFSAPDGNSVRYRSGGPYPEPSVGEVFPTNIEQTFARLNVSAVLEPDCDADGFGDETQDADQSSCNPKADGTLTIDANKGKVEKGRKVTLTGQLDVASNESCEQNRQIQIQRRLKSQDDIEFHAFQTVNTDAAGNYSLRTKVKKTRFYRAIVGETEACDDETSNSQKVRVQKPKAAQEA